VATGIGFLGAGEIVVPRQFDAAAPPEVRGLSSAASIWFTASLGVTVAASSPVIALVALGLALVTLSSRLRWPQRRRPAAGGGAEDQKKHQKRKR
jgi:putative Mg2+ transporter-C (MgtC) family protein